MRSLTNAWQGLESAGSRGIISPHVGAPGLRKAVWLGILMQKEELKAVEPSRSPEAKASMHDRRRIQLS
jgi:hypothetical protein